MLRLLTNTKDALLYGAGDAKLGAIVGGGAKEGKRLKEKFFKAIPSMGKLTQRVKDITERRKWVKGIDGRILRVRSSHSALNALLQGAGAIIMKYWLVEVATNADAEGLDWNPCANVHDEGQFEVHKDDAERFKEICEAAFITVSERLNLYCICTGTADIGSSWLYTH